MDRKGICCAGSIVVDISYPIETWPKQGELTYITDSMQRSTGGAVCNTVIDLARLDPTLPLYACGCVGYDSEGDFVIETMGKYPNIDHSFIGRSGQSAFTLVLSNNATKERTFFHHPGENQRYCEDDIPWENLDVDIFHIGYILLLPGLDAEDAQYGTKMARLLHRVQEMGIKTSIDVVSETGSRYQTIVSPALRYSDYCVINELEAQQTTGIPLRDPDGTLLRENLLPALRKMKQMGVSTWAVIHCPELGCGVDENGDFFMLPSLTLPDGYIKGTVGAGDAFCSGILYGAQMHWSLQEAIKLGICTAAASLHEANASDGVLHYKEVLKLYEQYGQA